MKTRADVVATVAVVVAADVVAADVVAAAVIVAAVVVVAVVVAVGTSDTFHAARHSLEIKIPPTLTI